MLEEIFKRNCSVIIIIIGILGILCFLPPFFRSIINLGNLTGMGVSVLIFLYGIFFVKINHLIFLLWHHSIGKWAVIFSGIVLAVILLLTVIITGCLISSAAKPPSRNDTAAIVLGCAVHGTRPSLMLETRLQAALTYLEENPERKAILSGGKGPGEDITEAQCMFTYLTEHGISKDRLFLEENSTDTRENLIFSKKILDTFQTGKKVVIITNEFHQYRAGILAKELGLSPRSVNAHTLFYLLPTYYVRELYAVLHEWIS